MGTIPNRGAAGDALDATVTGLVRVEGPCLWTPRGGQNCLHTATSFAWSYPVVTARVFLWADPANHGDGGNTAIISHWGPGTTSRRWMIGQSYLTGGLTLWSRNDSGAVYPTTTWVPPVSGFYWLQVTWDSTGIDVSWCADQDAEPSGAGWNALPRLVVDLAYTGSDVVFPLCLGNLYAPPTTLTDPYEGVIKYVRVESAASDLLYELTPTDISNAAPDASVIYASTGQATTVVRAASGPVTTIVPDGVVEYINPGASASNLIDKATAQYVAPDEDVFIAIACSVRQFDATFNAAFTFYGAVASLFAFRDDDTNRLTFRVRDDSAAERNVSLLNYPTNRVVVLALALDRAAGRWRASVHGEEGVISSSFNPTITDIGSLTLSSLRLLDGRGSNSFSGALWNKGVGIAPTDAELAVIARRLLVAANREAISSTGALPPAWAPVHGDRWRAENGHVVRFDGAVWQPETPLDGNVAAMIANMQLVIGAAG